MIITALMPDGTQAVLNVAPLTLVYNGQAFVQPENLKYVELYYLPVDAFSLPYREVVETLVTESKVCALVINLDPTEVPDTDPAVVSAPDPSGGVCICGLTCTGTDIRFAVVYLET